MTPDTWNTCSWEEWFEHLSHPFASNLNRPLAAPVKEFWAKLLEVVPQLSPPTQAGFVDDDLFEFVWDEGKHHFDIDILPDRKMEWFYHERGTGKADGDDETTDAISDRLVEHLKRFERTK